MTPDPSDHSKDENPDDWNPDPSDRSQGLDPDDGNPDPSEHSQGEDPNDGNPDPSDRSWAKTLMMGTLMPQTTAGANFKIPLFRACYYFFPMDSLSLFWYL